MSKLLTDLGEHCAMSHFARPAKARPRTRQGSLHTVFVIAAFLTLGLFLNGKYVTWKQHTAPVAIAPSDDEIYTGSILIMPPEGRICRQILFDNRTGAFSDNGNVDCERASYQGPGAKHWSPARLWAISRGFH
jgi:hypothetical protein